MKVLFIHDTIDINGGAELFVKDQINLLRNHKINVSVFYIGRRSNIKQKDVFFYQESRVGFYRKIAKIFFDPLLVHQLRQFIKSSKPDIIHLHHMYNYPLSILLALPKGIPVVKSVYDYGLVCASSWGVNIKTGEDCYCGYSIRSVINGCISALRFFIFLLGQKAQKYLIKVVSRRVFAADQHIKYSLEKVGYKNITITSYFSPSVNSNKHLTTHIDSRHLLFIGQLTITKGVHDLLKAVTLVKDKGYIFSLDIIGDGPLLYSLKKEAKNLGLQSNVKFHGYVERDQLIAFYNRSLVLIVPSIWKQNLPLVMMEAMANGLPVIASNTGSSPYIIKPEINGFLFEARNYKDLSQKILYCLENESKIHKMRRTTYDFALKEFSPERYFLEMNSHYEEVIKNEKRKNS